MKSVALMTVWSVAAVVCAETYSVVSPDGKNEIRLMTEPVLSYEILSGGRARTAPSAIGMDIAGRPALGGEGLRVKSVSKADRKGCIRTPIYKKAAVDETANGLRIVFGDWSIELVARDDGVAYRFATDFQEQEVTVVSERADVAFSSKDQIVYAAPNYGAGADDPLQNSWEGVYTRQTVSAAPKDFAVLTNGLWYAPLTFVYDDGGAMCVQESDLWDYPGWNFQGGDDEKSLKALFGAYPKRMVYANWGKIISRNARATNGSSSVKNIWLKLRAGEHIHGGFFCWRTNWKKWSNPTLFTLWPRRMPSETRTGLSPERFRGIGGVDGI